MSCLFLGCIYLFAHPLAIFSSFGFSAECLGQHSGSDQTGNLGDGNGWRRFFSQKNIFVADSHVILVNETAVVRWNYGDAQLGACKETIQGGNHFRYWVQDGKNANRYEAI